MFSFWWIFPLVGFVMCLAFMFIVLRAIFTGRGGMCMGAHADPGRTDVAEMRREIQTLRDELKEVKATR
jgi:hypothetical protein